MQPGRITLAAGYSDLLPPSSEHIGSTSHMLISAGSPCTSIPH